VEKLSCGRPGFLNFINLLILRNSPAPKWIDAGKKALNFRQKWVNFPALPGGWGAGVSIA